MTTAALILMHDQLRLLEANEEQKEIRVAGELGALVRCPQIHECELVHTVDAGIVFKHFEHDIADNLVVEIQRLAEVRQELPEDVDKLFIARSCNAIIVIFGDFEVGIDQLMIRVNRRKFTENKQRQLKLHQRNICLTLWIEDVPEKIAQDRDGILQVEFLVLNVETSFLSCEEDVMYDVGQLTWADTLLRRSLLVLLND